MKLNPSQKLPRGLQWVNEKGELCDKVGHDMALFGSAFCLPPVGEKLYIPEDLVRPGDFNKKGVPLNDLIKRRRKKQEKTIDNIEAELRAKRIKAFISNGMCENSEDGGMNDIHERQYDYVLGKVVDINPEDESNTKINLKGLAVMAKRYGQVFTN